MSRGKRPSGTRSASSSARGVLSSSDLGRIRFHRVNAQPTESSVTQRAPEHDGKRICAIDLFRPEISPYRYQATHSSIEIVSSARKCSRVDGTRRCPGDDGERVARCQRTACLAPQIHDRFEYSHLVGGASSATGQEKAGSGR